MKKTVFLFVIFFMATIPFSFSQTTYNKALADSLGADEYGMKMYVMVILKTGPAKITDKAVSDSLFGGHMANITRLVDEGKLIVAGPLGKNDLNYRGIFIFDMPLTETESVLMTDPTVKAGVFEYEIVPWYGSAALKTYLPFHKQVEKNSH